MNLLSKKCSSKKKQTTILDNPNKFMKILIACGIGYDDLKDREWFIEELATHKYYCTGYHPTLMRMSVTKENVVV